MYKEVRISCKIVPLKVQDLLMSYETYRTPKFLCEFLEIILITRQMYHFNMKRLNVFKVKLVAMLLKHEIAFQ